METAWKSAGDGCDDGGAAGYDSRRQNTHVTNYSFDVSNISNTSYDWRTPAGVTEASVVHALLFNVTGNTKFHNTGIDSNSNSYHHRVPDPHMMCLKLGKRHYCKDSAESSSTTGKRGNPSSSPAPVVPICQVEGCHVTLGDGKEYYRKHKVCELHSKSPKVVVSGFLQRFCQQCSRFHEVTEFDEAKRSCRRRLKGHNQRRRKGTNSVKLLPSSNSGCAYSLLSSPVTKPAGDLPARCSAALYELIVANRANSNSGHISNQNVYHQSVSDDSTHTFQGTQMWDRIGYTTATAVAPTEKVDVKQAPALEFGLLKVKDPEEWTDYCW